MPELPEVETVARGLRRALPGRRILEVRLGKTDFIADPAALEAHLPGSRIAAVRRYGKFLLVDLEPDLEPGLGSDLKRDLGGDSERDPKRANDGGMAMATFSLLIHLGMTGHLLVCKPDAEIAPHTHVFFALDDGRELRYTDIRRFGKMKLLQNGDREAALAHFGFDPLEASETQFCAQIGSRRARIKALLLDQSVLRGIGNIYADESLWHARIHPMRIGANLKGEEGSRLYRAVQRVLKEAIRLRGSSVSDYVDSEGLPGEFQSRHRVYQRHGKKCSRCGAQIRRAIVAGRSSHFCPQCQRAPRSRVQRGRAHKTQRQR